MSTYNVLLYDTVTKEVVSGPAPNPFPNGTQYSDYLFWNPTTSQWAVGSTTVHLGDRAGQISQGSDSIAIGGEAARTNQSYDAVAIGHLAGGINQSFEAVAIGNRAGQTNQGGQSVAIGMFAAQTGQGIRSVAIGLQAGQSIQLNDSVALGNSAAQFNQRTNSIAIGYQAGQYTQNYSAVAIGDTAGRTAQGIGSVAIGNFAGARTQGEASVAIGQSAGGTAQSFYSVAIGIGAGANTQGNSSVAIGRDAGAVNQGQFAVAIGPQAGLNSQHPNSIILNASGSSLNSLNSNAFYVAPVANSNAGYAPSYNRLTKELGNFLAKKTYNFIYPVDLSVTNGSTLNMQILFSTGWSFYYARVYHWFWPTTPGYGNPNWGGYRMYEFSVRRNPLSGGSGGFSSIPGGGTLPAGIPALMAEAFNSPWGSLTLAQNGSGNIYTDNTFTSGYTSLYRNQFVIEMTTFGTERVEAVQYNGIGYVAVPDIGT